MTDLVELIDKWENSALNLREAETLIKLLLVDNKQLEKALKEVYVTEPEVAKRFKRYFRAGWDSQAEAGKFYGKASRQFISAVGTGKKKPTSKMLEDLGLEKRIVYVKIK